MKVDIFRFQEVCTTIVQLKCVTYVLTCTLLSHRHVSRIKLNKIISLHDRLCLFVKLPNSFFNDTI